MTDADRHAARCRVVDAAKPWLRAFLASVVAYGRELDEQADFLEKYGVRLRADSLLVKAAALRVSSARVDAYLEGSEHDQTAVS